jgi:AraC-like DNA-binding protein
MERLLGIIPEDLCGIAWKYENQGRRIGRHRHGELELNHVVSGQATYLVRDQRVELKPHTQLWLFPAQDHVLVEQGSDFSMWIACWSPEYLQGSCLSAESQSLLTSDPGEVVSRCLRPDISHGLTELLTESIRQRDRSAYNAGMGYVCHRAWTLFQESESLPPAHNLHPAIQRATQLLAEPEMNRTIGEVARLCGISPSHLGDLFRSQLGISPVEMRNRHRIDRFLEIYSPDGETTMMHAALLAGFGSYAQFHRVFKNIMGYGPAEYRRRMSRAERSPSPPKA